MLVALESRLAELSYEILKQHEICFRYYPLLKETIDELDMFQLEYLFKIYNLELDKSDNNYFNEEMEMRVVLRDYLYMDSYLIVDQFPNKRLVK